MALVMAAFLIDQTIFIAAGILKAERAKNGTLLLLMPLGL
jgi:hypothetical protein